MKGLFTKWKSPWDARRIIIYVQDKRDITFEDPAKTDMHINSRITLQLGLQNVCNLIIV